MLRPVSIFRLYLSRYHIWSQSYATAVVLLVVVLGINGLSSFIAKRIGRSHT